MELRIGQEGANSEHGSAIVYSTLFFFFPLFVLGVSFKIRHSFAEYGYCLRHVDEWLQMAICDISQQKDATDTPASSRLGAVADAGTKRCQIRSI